ncbi:hypothetical protein ABAC460_03730 [Asticcacaulis sp. AC460]|uniref:carbohydrate binding domain-containing protein n=1 Tax=Asticcacaulis sp. AC460 TaxID=1282360 RepID=UPI0003C3D57D|nr:carbohydrate binding domain-containing protein [Asticcacaulis sp. AC460]ESQ92020.1 hypothetical protein ABAC460_03730 [Asticcacaulis sp. AC460]
MKRRDFLAGTVCALAFTAVPAFAEDKLINDPSSGWQVYGQQTNKRIKDAAVQGGYAIEVKIPAKGANPWDSAAQTDITGDIKKGDKILAAVWLKAKTEDGSPAHLNIRVQINSAPYTSLVESTQSVGPEWKLYAVETTATQDYNKKTVVLAVHLAGAKQTVYLGPAFVLIPAQ